MSRIRLDRFGWATELAAAGFAGGLLLSIGVHAGIAWLSEATEVDSSGATVEATASRDSQTGPVNTRVADVSANAVARDDREAVSARTAMARSLARLEPRVGGVARRSGAAHRDMAAPVPTLRPADVAILQAAIPVRKPALAEAGPRARSTASATDMPERPRSLFGAELPERVVRQAALPGPGEPGPAAGEPDQDAEAEQVFADARPVNGSELGEMRGGFFDVGGWKISFGIEINVNIDNFSIGTQLKDVTRMRGVKVNVGGDKLVRKGDGTFDVNGTPVTNGNVGLGDFAGNVQETEQGFTLTGAADGKPVKLSVEEGRVTQAVGTMETTLIRQDLSPRRIIQQLNNRLSNVNNSGTTVVNIDILNHDKRVRISRRFQAADSLAKHIQSGMISRLAR